MNATPAKAKEVHNFHVSDEKNKEYSAKIFARAIRDKRIARDEERLIRDFVTSLPRMSWNRRYKYFHYLIVWREYMGHYSENTVAQVQKAVDDFYDSKRFSPSVQREAIYIISRFYKWLVAEGYSSVDMAKLKSKFKLPKNVYKTKNRAQMLTPQEVVSMIRACNNSMERAFVSALYYGAFRIVEMGRLRWDQVAFTDKSVKIKVMEKTDRERDVPVIDAREYMARWKAEYPGDPSGDNPVFISRYKKPFRYQALLWRLQAIARRAGITKHVSGHIPRHSRITGLQVEGVSDATIKYMAWGGESMMLRSYSHFQSEDAENELAEKQGLTQPPAREETPTSRMCPECGAVLGPSYDYCPYDGTPLTKEKEKAVTSRREQFLKLVMDEPDLLIEIVNELKKNRK